MNQAACPCPSFLHSADTASRFSQCNAYVVVALHARLITACVAVTLLLLLLLHGALQLSGRWVHQVQLQGRGGPLKGTTHAMLCMHQHLPQRHATGPDATLELSSPDTE